MKSIKRFELEIQPKQIVEIPFNSEILAMGKWGEIPCIWAMVDSDQRAMKREVVMIADGKELDAYRNKTNYLGSFEAKAEVGAVMLHVFESQV